jgi:hypothetical protein
VATLVIEFESHPPHPSIDRKTMNLIRTAALLAAMGLSAGAWAHGDDKITVSAK